MRPLAATAIAITLVAIAGAAEAREASVYRGECGEAVLPTGPTGLSSPLRIETRCGSFVVDATGVRFAGVRKATGSFDRLSWRGGRLRFHRAGRIRWRSRGRYPRRAKFSVVEADHRSLAFQQWGGPLYMAGYGQAERVVGRVNEVPVGWTRAGILVTWQSQRLQGRTRFGRVVPIKGHRRGTFSFHDRTLLFASSRRELVRTDGRRTRRVASLRSLALGRWFQISPLPSGRIILTGRRLVVLAANGAVVATDRGRGGAGAPAEGPDGAVATITTRHFDNYRRATESVRLLRPGGRASSVLFTHVFSPRPCAHMATLAWRGTDLLYWTSEGHVVVIDTRSGKHVDLTRAARRLPGDVHHAGWA